LGVGAYDGGTFNNDFKGLKNQIRGAASTLRRHYDDAQGKDTITLQIDGRTVSVENPATYSLYKYTPHFHGNSLFHSIYLKHFGFFLWMLNMAAV